MSHPYAYLIAAVLDGERKTSRRVLLERVDFVHGRKDYANVVYRHTGGGYADWYESVSVRGLTPMQIYATIVDEGWQHSSDMNSNVDHYYPPRMTIIEE